MLELKIISDIGQDIKNYILSRHKKSDKMSDVPLNLRLINQEKDGSILFTWDEKQPEDDVPRTYIGLFCHDSKNHQIVWTFNQVEYVASCSINQHHTLVAFTILNQNEEGLEGYDVYTAFLAEILEPNRLFSLNIERINFLKVQFLHLTTGPGQGNEMLEREAYMLVFLHKESISLYHIPLARAGEDAMVMKRQPEKEQLAGEFMWCSWDVHHQRLHYIYHQHDEKDVNYRNCHTILSTLQFGFNGKYDSMVDVPLNFPFPFDSKTSFPSYIDIPLCSVIPDRSLNIEVITHSNGTFCVCYQPTLSVEKFSPRRFAKKEDEAFDVVYFVCMVHHVHTLQGTVFKVPYEATYRRLIFTWYNGYLVVCLPGFFTHMLNASIEYEPCNHILLHEESLIGEVCPVISSKSTNMISEIEVQESPSVPLLKEDELSLLHSNNKKLQLMSHYCKGMCISGWTLYDRKKQLLYKVKLNKEKLVDLFSSCYLSTTRMAIFHYAILHERDYNVTKKIFESLSNDCASPEVQEIFAEFLVSTTYLNMRRRVSKNILLLVPFTTSDTFRGQYEKNEATEILAKIQYHVLPSIKIGKKTAKDRLGRLHFEDLWDTLRQHLRQNQLMQLQFPRFSASEIIQHKVSLLLTTTQNIEHSTWHFVDGESFLNKLGRSHSYTHDVSSSESDAELGKASTPEPILGSLPSFLRSMQLTREFRMLMQLVKDTFTEFLIKFLKCEPQVKLENIAKEYVASQLHQARQLCHMVWSIKKPEENQSLTQPASQDEYELFQLFERILMALKEQAFPITEGFCTYFTILAFRCLPQSQFLHYVDSGVLVMTEVFVSQLLQAFDGEEHVSLKYQIITRLPEKLVLSCCQKWNHPYAITFFTMHNVQEMLLSQSMEWGLPAEDHIYFTNSQNSEESKQVKKHPFYPLSAFMEHLNEKNHSEQEGVELPGGRQLQDTALCHTYHETDCDLGVVNF